MMRVLSLIACLLIAAAASAASPTTSPATAPTTAAATRPTTAPMVEDLGTDTTLITFSARQIPLADAIRQIGRQAHASAGLYPPPQAAARFGGGVAPNPAVDLDVKDKPFWTVALVLAQANGLRLQTVPDMPVAFSLSGRSVPPGPTVISGPCYISIPRISRDDLLDFADLKNPQRRLQLTLNFLIEPKIASPKGIELRIIELSDAAGQPLLVSETMQQSGGIQSNKLITLRRPPGDGRIALLKGEVRFTAPRRCPRWYIDDVVAAPVPQSVQVDGKTCSLHAVRKIGATLEVEISVDGKFPTTQPSDPAPVQLFDKNGVRLNMMRKAETNGRMMVSFARSGSLGVATEPFTLVWAFPAETQEFVYPFEFKNLPVP